MLLQAVEPFFGDEALVMRCVIVVVPQADSIEAGAVGVLPVAFIGPDREEAVVGARCAFKRVDVGRCRAVVVADFDDIFPVAGFGRREADHPERVEPPRIVKTPNFCHLTGRSSELRREVDLVRIEGVVERGLKVDIEFELFVLGDLSPLEPEASTTTANAFSHPLLPNFARHGRVDCHDLRASRKRNGGCRKTKSRADQRHHDVFHQKFLENVPSVSLQSLVQLF